MPDATRTALLQKTDIRRRASLPLAQSGSAQTGASVYMPFPGKITAVSFFNNSGANFSAAASVAVTAGTVASSTATLANLASERKTTMTNNTNLAEGAAITLTTGTTAGTGITYATVEVQENMVSA